MKAALMIVLGVLTGIGSASAEKFVYRGEAKFAYGFSSHMVIQRDTEANVWGYADPDSPVEISIGGQTVANRADRYGKWLVQLSPMKAGGPYTMQLKSGSTCVELEDVLFGDVWICSGQSNMRYGLSRRAGKGEDAPYIYQDELDSLRKQTSFPIRHVMDLRGKFDWLKVTHENVVDEKKNPPGVTAVGYFFAKHLREDIGDVPIGIIQTGSGGKAIRHCTPWPRSGA